MSQKHEDIDRLPEDMNQVREDMNPKHQDMNCALEVTKTIREGTKTIRDEADALPVLRAAPAVERRGFPVDAKSSRRERGPE